MDELRHKIMDTARKVRWIPEFGLARELDWLRNMHDWMISKKRYYGLALPIYECQACGSFEVIGSETELRERAVAGWSVFEGHSPHRPWVDAVQIACRGCGARIERIKDVGNPWLDAGIVPFSTLNYRHDPGYWRQWFPADWVSESFPGQFRNWFYALLAMGTVMVLDTEHEGTPPFLTLFSYALLRDEHGEEMHKSKGNAIWFDDAAEAIGADVMRWLYLRANPASNLNFGFGIGDEIKRGFLSTLWNTYSFFVIYANIDGWTPASRPDPLSLRGEGETASPSALRERGPRDESVQPAARPSGRSRESRSAEGAAPLPGGVGGVPPSSLISEAEQRENDARPASPDGQLTELDRWALSELNQLVETCTRAFESYDSMTAARQIEEFVEALSNWYVRRSRRRFWKAESDADKQAAYETLWTCLATLNRLMAPMTPFLAEEMYQNLVRSWDANALESVHLCDWPAARQDLIDEELEASVRLVQRLSSLGRAARAKANLRVRQPLAAIYIRVQNQREGEVVRRLADQLLDELNVKSLDLIAEEGEYFDYQVLLNLPVLGRKYGARMAALQRAFAAADKASVARRKLDGAPVELDGFELQPDELLVSLAGRPGFAVAEDGGYAVAVTTEVTPELADEGLARELVRRIQEMRKSAGFEPADRIRLGYEGDPDVARVLREWGDYISHETLAEAIAPGAAGGYSEPHTIDGRRLKLSVERV
jgi:isoleucyl-tRNA synthetase